MSDVNYATTAALDRLDERVSKQIEELYDRTNANNRSIVKLETLYTGLSELPSAIISLEKAIVSIEHNLKTMTDRIEQMNDSIQVQRDSLDEIRKKNQEQDKNIEAVDNKSKVDWMEFVTANFWKIIVGAVGIAAALKVLIGL